jgi:hypothetical protein
MSESKKTSAKLNGTNSSELSKLRKKFHANLLGKILTVKDGVPSNADKSSKLSVAVSLGIVNLIGRAREREKLAGQTSGNKFEDICRGFIGEAFLKMNHLRPGVWKFNLRGEISQYEQYFHLNYLDQMSKKDSKLAAIVGSDYMITPDIMVSRDPEPDDVINKQERLVDDENGVHASLRRKYNSVPIMHASISCKWTIRSDRAQNSRTEALNLIRNRKGKLPHVMVITGEPLPGRLASIALGTGDVDCVYHFALPELLKSAEVALKRKDGFSDSKELLDAMVEGKRLKDISDLPLDLAI